MVASFAFSPVIIVHVQLRKTHILTPATRIVKELGMHLTLHLIPAVLPEISLLVSFVCFDCDGRCQACEPGLIKKIVQTADKASLRLTKNLFGMTGAKAFLLQSLGLVGVLSSSGYQLGSM